MANITITIPNGLVADVQAAIGDALGEDADGLTSRQQFVLFVRRAVQPHLRARRRRENVDLSAEEAARAAVEAALAVEATARKAAVVAEDAQVDADLGTLS